MKTLFVLATVAIFLRGLAAEVNDYDVPAKIVEFEEKMNEAGMAGLEKIQPLMEDSIKKAEEHIAAFEEEVGKHSDKLSIHLDMLHEKYGTKSECFVREEALLKLVPSLILEEAKTCMTHAGQDTSNAIGKLEDEIKGYMGYPYEYRAWKEQCEMAEEEQAQTVCFRRLSDAIRMDSSFVFRRSETDIPAAATTIANFLDGVLENCIVDRVDLLDSQGQTILKELEECLKEEEEMH